MITPMKMRHHDPERHAAEFVTGELSRRARRWFSSHLLECEDCWREVLLGRLGHRLASDVREQPPSGLRDRVRALVALEARSHPRRRGRRERHVGRS
jgi:hypothetical protein